VQKGYQDSTVATAGAIVIYLHSSHGTTKEEVLYLRLDWKKVFGILVESLSAERAGYPSDGLRANSWSRVHRPDNPELLGAIGTPGDKSIGHKDSLPGLPLTLEIGRRQPRNGCLSDA